MKVIYTKKREEILVDDEDFEFLSQYTWHLVTSQRIYKTVKTSVPIQELKEGKLIVRYKSKTLSHILLGSPEPDVWDHQDGNPLNNQRNNLRKLSRLRNSHNQRKRSGSTTSAFKGVCLRDNGTWISRIMANGKRKELGYYSSELDAALAYNAACVFYHGDCAVLNHIPQELIYNVPHRRPPRWEGK